MRVYLIWDDRDYYGPDPTDYDWNPKTNEQLSPSWIFATRELAEAEIASRVFHTDGLRIEEYEVVSE